MKPAAIRLRDFSHFLGAKQTLKQVNLEAYRHEILGVIGPAGSGKSSFLRALNRLNDIMFGSRTEGGLEVEGQDIYAPGTSLTELRRRLGMVFAIPVPLPRSIYENIVFGPRLSGLRDRSKLDGLARDALEKTSLWEEVKDRLHSSALKLSGGQQQRLCIARVLALRPEFILLDEPTSGLDPISTMKIEESLQTLKRDYTIILVTNNTKQAARASDRTAFFLMSELIEIDRTEKLFTNPSHNRTVAYITGHFG